MIRQAPHARRHWLSHRRERPRRGVLQLPISKRSRPRAARYRSSPEAGAPGNRSSCRWLRPARDFTVEIKFNGELRGSPYMLMGGRMPGWYSYSFEDYFSDWQTAGRRVACGRRKQGRRTENRGPAEPYKLVWQVRANGTHRIFPIYNPEAVRQAVRSMPLGTATGFVLEGLLPPITRSRRATTWPAPGCAGRMSRAKKIRSWSPQIRCPRRPRRRSGRRRRRRRCRSPPFSTGQSG